MNIAIEQLHNTPDHTLTDPRSVGRKSLGSTVQGLLFHAAEHAQRHLGQLIVTARIVGEAADSRVGSRGNAVDGPR